MEITRYDSYLDVNGPVALVIRETLIPVSGKDSPVFPPTFAPEEGSDKRPDYVINETGEGGNIALLDSVGSQANRLEPLFKRPPFDQLVPQVQIKIADRVVNLLDAGHRSADAIVRYSGAGAKVQAAFGEFEKTGKTEALAKLNPTALVFGVWDSRGTQSKFPRLVSSVVRATNVARLERSAQYISMIEKEEAQEIDSDQKFLSREGLSDAPAGRGPGGVYVRGTIVREGVLNLIPLRSLSAGDGQGTLRLQRYILGLALIAFTAPADCFLRQGCLLTADPDRPAGFEAVSRSGSRQKLAFAESEVLAFAQLAAAEFGVGESFTADFLPERAKAAKVSKPTKASKAGKG